MATLAEVNNININGNNYNRDQVVIEISGAGITAADITTTVLGIEYSEEAEVEFQPILGSRRPGAVGFGNITGEGSLNLSDAGLSKLNEVAIEGGLPSMLYLGQTGKIDITISYTTYNGLVKTDILEHVFFTTYSNGVNTGDVLYEREVPMIIGKITIGVLA